MRITRWPASVVDPIYTTPGDVNLVEHGPSSTRAIHGAQKVLDPLFVRFQADHITRDPLPFVAGAGFRVDEVHRSRAGMVFRVATTKPEG